LGKIPDGATEEQKQRFLEAEQKAVYETWRREFKQDKK
jgi:hypothetical protein